MSKIAEGYNERYGNIISPHATVEIPFGWIPAVGDMLQRIADLPTDIRAFLIVTGIDQDPTTGLLDVVIGAATELMPNGGMDEVLGIVHDARNVLAWTCETDGNEGWLVNGKRGPVVLCPQCQANHGMQVVRHGS